MLIQCLFLEIVEDLTTGLAARLNAAREPRTSHLRENGAVHLAHLQHRCDEPDMVEGNRCELAAPLSGDADATQ
ncbi:hypothetical protein DPMN_175471 [Dreissena polymorpha]|uniref:Uncharacterized protein n=1 Tax=Dreissena polymorpha TaxID=45954 RepID=A0A9D4E7Y6_DREPO|nr:hypothetical protein DPMN_175471 [Dreissena polymorpha]